MIITSYGELLQGKDDLQIFNSSKSVDKLHIWDLIKFYKTYYLGKTSLPFIDL